MQRLKNIHVLGPNYLVFPGATHMRFEHSVGTAHLCNLMMEHLAESHKPCTAMSQVLDRDLFTEVEHKCVVLAGLMHDLGHGIYSHMFDRHVIKSISESSQTKYQSNGTSQNDNNLEARQHILDSLTSEKSIIGWEHEDAS